MNLLISCSMRHLDGAKLVAEALRRQGHTVDVPTTEPLGAKRHFIDNHLKKLQIADALLLVNLPEAGSTYGRVGASGFFEVGWAYALGKPAYYLHPLDPESPYTEDIEAVATKFDHNEGEVT